MENMQKRLREAVEEVELWLGFSIPDEVAQDVLRYAKRKLEVIQQNEEKPDDYLPLLYVDELKNHYIRAAINRRSEMLVQARRAMV